MQQFAVFYYQKSRIVGDSIHRSYEEILGSDGYIPLDGRYNLETCKRVAEEHASKQNKSTKKIDGYRVARGKLSRPFFLTAGVIPV